MAEKKQKKAAGKSETENSKKSKKSVAEDRQKAKDTSKSKEMKKVAEKKNKATAKTMKSGKAEAPETKAPKAKTSTKKDKAKSEAVQKEDYIVIKSSEKTNKLIEKTNKSAEKTKKPAEKSAPKEDYIVIKSVEKPAKKVNEFEEILFPAKEILPHEQEKQKPAHKQLKPTQKANPRQAKQALANQNQQGRQSQKQKQAKKKADATKQKLDTNLHNVNLQTVIDLPKASDILELPKAEQLLKQLPNLLEMPKVPSVAKLPASQNLPKLKHLPKSKQNKELSKSKDLPQLPAKSEVKLIDKHEDSYVAMLPSGDTLTAEATAMPEDGEAKVKAGPADKSKQKQSKNAKKDKKQETKKTADKKKAIYFSFINLAPKSANQVSLNKVKQVFGETEDSSAIEVAKKENPDFLPRNFYGRYNFIDMRTKSLMYQKRVIVNPVFTYAPEVSINKYKEQEGDKPAPVQEEVKYEITLDNPLLKVEFYSKNKKFVFPSDALAEAPTEAPKDAKAKKSKKKNKYEEEALALKNEAIVLPPEDYIKYTFPELEEEREKNKEKAHREVRFTHINPEHKLIFSENMNADIRTTLDKVMQAMDEEFSSPEGARILLAVSGGVDSIALLDIFAQIAEIKKYNISVAHFNHNLRGASSDRDEAAVKQICDKYGIKCYVGSENIMKYAAENSVSIEQAARINRYKMFERLAGNLKLDFVATAHTADDSVETFFLNLFRGSGLTGLSGIPHKRLLVKTTYMIRPLIDLSKEDLIHYAKLRQLPWNEDESNSLTHYTRNKIRLELLPQIMNEYSPAIFDVINRTARLIRGADEFISDYVQNAVESLIRDRRKDRFYISIPQLQTYSEYIQGELIQGLLSFVFKTLPFGVKTIDRIMSLCESPVGSTFNVNKQIYVIKDRNKLIFALRNGADTVNMNIDKISETELPLGKLVISKIQRNKVEYTRDPNIEFVDADLLPLSLNVRNWQPGDVFKPLGMDGTMKVSDFLTNQKVSIIDKQAVVVLSTKSEIIWVVGRRLSNDYKVNPLTRNVLKLEFIPSKK